jgi:hypothetical protein
MTALHAPSSARRKFHRNVTIVESAAARGGGRSQPTATKPSSHSTTMAPHEQMIAVALLAATKRRLREPTAKR